MNRVDHLHQTAASGAVLVDRSSRLRLDVSGPDRAKFLHNLTTQDVKRLAPGKGGEAFVTNPQGKTLGYVTLLLTDDRVVIRSDREGAGPITPHLVKYGVFDDVTIDDVSDQTFEFHLAGPSADAVARAAGVEPPQDDLTHSAATLGGVPVRVVREGVYHASGLTLVGPRDRAGVVLDSIRAAGSGFNFAEATEPELEALRIEQGTPAGGRDVTPDNLPQEVARDARTINFVKGCYLGQETVARIDALGHVNKVLRGLRLYAPQLPPSDATLEAGGKAVGKLTTAAYSPLRQCTVALGYLRTSHSAAGTAVHVVSPAGEPVEAIVCDLPMSPP